MVDEFTFNDMRTKIVWRHVPQDWSDGEFEQAGGIVAVVLNFNKAGLIGQAVRSALEQDYNCYEVLALDDHSQDGSDREMLEEVRLFLKCHPAKKVKVTVAVNEENRTILGQWVLANYLCPRGMWFGMFCGDDVSFLNRISYIKRLVDKYPTAWGVCTNVSLQSGECLIHDGKLKQLMTWHSDSSDPMGCFFGCSAFWRREVFAKSLPRMNLDDYFLYWAVKILRSTDSDVALVWDMRQSTVRYSVGTGITQDLYNEARKAKGILAKSWHEWRASRERGRRFGLSVWRAIQAYDYRNGENKALSEQINGRLIISIMESCGWWRRMFTFFKVCILEGGKEFGGIGSEIRRTVRSKWVYNVLGPFSFCVCKVLSSVSHGRDIVKE